MKHSMPRATIVSVLVGGQSPGTQQGDRGMKGKIKCQSVARSISRITSVRTNHGKRRPAAMTAIWLAGLVVMFYCADWAVASDATSDDTGLEEITVTAEKFNSTIQN